MADRKDPARTHLDGYHARLLSECAETIRRSRELLEQTGSLVSSSRGGLPIRHARDTVECDPPAGVKQRAE